MSCRRVDLRCWFRGKMEIKWHSSSIIRMPLLTQNMHILSLHGFISLNHSIHNLWFVHKKLAKQILYFISKLAMLLYCSCSTLNWSKLLLKRAKLLFLGSDLKPSRSKALIYTWIKCYFHRNIWVIFLIVAYKKYT